MKRHEAYCSNGRCFKERKTSLGEVSIIKEITEENFLGWKIY